ncbi:MAG: ABC transporter ATP-binding protein [Acidobacteriota bacterium]
MLQADSVSFAYPAGVGARRRARGSDLVLDQVSATIPGGAIVGLLGPNGSGKTTLLRLMSGTRRPTRGRVLLDGAPLDGLSRRALARRIAVVPQETHSAFEYSVLEMVLMGRHPHLGLFELEGPDDFAVARQAMVATGTEHLEHRQFNTLSGGEKQRVVIAAALAQASEILLLDEPTASLDLGYQLEVASLVATLNRDRRVTIVVSTHDLNFAASVCQELILLREGRVIAAGATADVLTPEHVAALYDVSADIETHAATQRLVVVPISRSRSPR